MHELLFDHRHRLAPADLLDHARHLRLDLTRFARELAEETYAPVVRAHFMSGVRSGVNGTPTFFITGYRHNGDYGLPSLLDALRDALAAAA
jgi:protein-disulfide isomerase